MSVAVILAGNRATATGTWRAEPDNANLSGSTASACVTDGEGDTTAAVVDSTTIDGATIVVVAHYDIPDAHGGGKFTFTIDIEGPIDMAGEACFSVKRRREPAVP